MLFRKYSAMVAAVIILLLINFKDTSFISGKQQNKNKSVHTSSSNFIFGIMIAPSDAFAVDMTETYFKICKDLGVQYLKIGVLWDLVEPEDGRFIWKSDGKEDERETRRSRDLPPRRRRDGRRERPRRPRDLYSNREMEEGRERPRRPRGLGSPRGSRNFDYDQIAALSQKYNVSVIPTFLRSKMPEREKAPDKYAALVYTFIKRYKKSMNIKFIEFQNEPNSGNDGSGNGRHWTGTAEDLVRVNNAVYDKIKKAYPDIQIGTAGFISGSRKMINTYTANFYKRYFKAKPKFDVFMLHEYPKNMNYTQGTKEGDFASQYHLLKTYRDTLNSYGYANKPILISEGYEDKPYRKYSKASMDWMDEEEASTLFVESYMFTMLNASKLNIIGKVISGVRTAPNQKIGLIDAGSGEKRAQYYAVKKIISLLRSYPIYTKHIAGKIDSEDSWIEEFTNKRGDRLWIAFNPVLYNTDEELLPTITSMKVKYPQRVTLNIGKASEVNIVSIRNGRIAEEKRQVDKGAISLNIEKSPIFITGRSSK